VTAPFPNGFGLPSSPAVTLGSGFSNCTANASLSGHDIIVTLGNGSSNCAVAKSAQATLTIAGIMNAGLGTYTTFAVHTDVDSVPVSSTATIGNGAVTVVTFSGSPQSAGATASTWTVGFTPTATGSLVGG